LTPPSSAKVKNMWNYTSTPPYGFKACKAKTSPYLESVMSDTLLTTHLIL